jgi:hypothetical protein
MTAHYHPIIRRHINRFKAYWLPEIYDKCLVVTPALRLHDLRQERDLVTGLLRRISLSPLPNVLTTEQAFVTNK